MIDVLFFVNIYPAAANLQENKKSNLTFSSQNEEIEHTKLELSSCSFASRVYFGQKMCSLISFSGHFEN